MTLDIDAIAKWAAAIVTILSLSKFIVAPFKTTMDNNRKTMRSLQDTIKDLSRDLKESQEDRKNIHKILERHDDRITQVENDTIKLSTYCESNKIKG